MRLACPASAGVGEMLCGNPIFLTAALAGSHNRHFRSPSFFDNSTLRQLSLMAAVADSIFYLRDPCDCREVL
jgi:hypothetical protein